MTFDELLAHQEELTEKLAREKIQLSIKRLDNPLQIRATRRDLARANTIINERRLAGEKSSTPGAGEAGDTEAL
jgi:ribosomal protein L29